jgi:diacylglycerol kinase (ATP)
MNKILIVFNPWAGRGKAGRQLPALEAALKSANLPYEISYTHVRGGATELVWQGIERGFDTIVAAGGDGTINEVVNGIKDSEVKFKRRATLGILPLGTGSDFVKSLDGFGSNDLVESVQRLVRRRTSTVDLGRVTVSNGPSRIFVNAVGMGIDAQVAAESLKIKSVSGLAVYLLAIFRTLRNFKAATMTVQYDGQKVQKPLMFASVSNGRCQGAGFWLAPTALLNDGRLDLCFVDKVGLVKSIRYLPLLMKGRHVNLPEVTMGLAKKINISCEAPMPVATDGEVVSTDAREIVVEVLPAALDVIV